MNDNSTPTESESAVNSLRDSLQEVDCPCCRRETFSHRDYLLEHLQQYHDPAEVYLAVVE